MQQHVTVNVVDAPRAPDTGSLSGLFDGVTASVLIAAVVSFVIIAIVLTLARKKSRWFLSVLVFLPLLGCVTFALHVAQAQSNLSIPVDNIAITAYKPELPIVKTTASVTTVNTNNPTGYKLGARLNQPLPQGISATLNDEPLTATLIDIYQDDTGNSPSNYSHRLKVEIPGNTPIGTYEFDIVYAITENPVIAPTTMQQLTLPYCNAIQNLEILTLTDARDGRSYNIRKMPDGKCWMITNLRLGYTGDTDGPNGDGTITLTPQDTNISQDWVLPRVTGQSGYNYTTPVIFDYPVQSSDINSDIFYGYHYNYCAATAGQDGTCTSLSAASSDATQSICPVNWRLPTGGDVSDGSYLNGMMAGDGTYSIEKDTTHIDNWLYDGYFRGVFAGQNNNGSWTSQGQTTVGYIWTSSRDMSTGWGAYRIGFAADRVDFTIHNKYYGLSVRCVLGS
jgi:uncharacterized protein (TIGR02145 family)